MANTDTPAPTRMPATTVITLTITTVATIIIGSGGTVAGIIIDSGKDRTPFGRRRSVPSYAPPLCETVQRPYSQKLNAPLAPGTERPQGGGYTRSDPLPSRSNASSIPCHAALPSARRRVYLEAGFDPAVYSQFDQRT